MPFCFCRSGLDKKMYRSKPYQRIWSFLWVLLLCCPGEHPSLKRMDRLYFLTHWILIFGNQLTPISKWNHIRWHWGRDTACARGALFLIHSWFNACLSRGNASGDLFCLSVGSFSFSMLCFITCVNKWTSTETHIEHHLSAFIVI